MSETKRFQVKFDCDNSAFDDDNLRPEIARILNSIADRVLSGDSIGTFRNVTDINGNIVGTFKLIVE